MATAKTTRTVGAPAETEPAAVEAIEERVPAFKIGEISYTFPAHIPVGWGLTYLRLHYGSSRDQALIWGLSRLLGDAQLLTLEQDPAVTRQDVAHAVALAREALLGGLEDPKD
jgi:hypothetical protein